MHHAIKQSLILFIIILLNLSASSSIWQQLIQYNIQFSTYNLCTQSARWPNLRYWRESYNHILKWNGSSWVMKHVTANFHTHFQLQEMPWTLDSLWYWQRREFINTCNKNSNNECINYDKCSVTGWFFTLKVLFKIYQMCPVAVFFNQFCDVMSWKHTTLFRLTTLTDWSGKLTIETICSLYIGTPNASKCETHKLVINISCQSSSNLLHPCKSTILIRYVAR